MHWKRHSPVCALDWRKTSDCDVGASAGVRAGGSALLRRPLGGHLRRRPGRHRSEGCGIRRMVQADNERVKTEYRKRTIGFFRLTVDGDCIEWFSSGARAARRQEPPGGQGFPTPLRFLRLSVAGAACPGVARLFRGVRRRCDGNRKRERDRCGDCPRNCCLRVRRRIVGRA